MAYQEVSGGTFYKFERAGQELEGTYLGKEAAHGKFEGENAILETPDGVVKVGISAGLKTPFASLEKGALIKIVYEGTKKNPKTGMTFKSFRLFKDDGQ